MKKLLILLLFLAPLGCSPKDDGAGDDGAATGDATAITGDETFTAEIVKISVPGMT